LSTLYSVGDKVLIKKDLEVVSGFKKLVKYKMKNSDSAYHVVNSMIKHFGEILTVESASEKGYTLSVVEGSFIWTDEMIEGKIVPMHEIEEVSVGDKIVVRDDLTGGSYYNGVFTAYEMEEFRNQVLTVNNTTFYEGVYSVKENGWSWTREMFKYAIVNPEDKVFYDDEEEEDCWDWIEEEDYWGCEEEIREEECPEDFAEVPEAEVEDVAQSKNELEIVDKMGYFGVQIDRVIYNEPATILFYRVPEVDFGTGFVKGLSNQRKVVAKCNVNEGDKFDKETGVKVALLRALEKEARRELSKI
jgi:hypothetical protein